MNRKILEKIEQSKIQLENLSKMDRKINRKILEKIEQSKIQLENLSKMDRKINKKVVNASNQIEKLNQVVIEDASKLIKYRQNITVPAAWVPFQGIRAANLSEVPVEKVSGLENYVTNVLESFLDGPGDSYFARDITIMSNIMDFKIISDSTLYLVPEGYIFNINSMEVLTTEITNPDIAPSIRFGTNLNPSLFYESNETMSNEQGYRHIIESPQNSTLQGTIITFGVFSGSTADSHFGLGIISGCLIKIEEV